MASPGLARIILSLVTVGLLAQSPPSKLLTFDVAAIDKRGNLISDLTADDFTVTDAGRRQQIVYFRRGQDVTAPRATLTREHSNHGYGTFPHATVILLDQLNARVELAGRQWDQVARSLQRAEGDPYTYFYVLQKNGAVYPVHGLPESWVESAPSEGHWTREILPLFEEARRQYRDRPVELDVSRLKPGSPEFVETMKRMQKPSETALQEFAVRLAAVPGPKSIVWVGTHVRGMTTMPVADPTGHIRDDGGHALDPVPIYYVAAAASVADFEDAPTPPLDGDVEKTIAGALADAQRAYRIGYDPPPENWDGRRHDVRISCKRPGVTVRAGSGYTAVRPVDIEDDYRQIVPDMVTVSPFDASTIRFSIDVLPDSTAPRFDLSIDARDVLFRHTGDRYSCTLAVVAIRYTEAGDVEMPEEAVPVNLNLTPDAYAAALRDGVPVRLNSRTVAPGTRFRLVVYDRATRSFGTLTVPAQNVPQ